MIVADTSVLFALLDADDRHHDVTVGWFREANPSLISTPLILAELGHLLGVRAPATACARFYADLAAGGITVEWWATAAAESAAIAAQHSDLRLGLADASLLALCARLETTTIATFDERHFRSLRPITGEAFFTLVPMDR